MYRVFLSIVILMPLAAQQYDPYTGSTVEESALDAQKDVPPAPPVAFKKSDGENSSKPRKGRAWDGAFRLLMLQSPSSDRSDANSTANSFGPLDPAAPARAYVPRSFGVPYYGSEPYESSTAPNFSLGVRNPYNPFIHNSPPPIPPALPRFPAIPQP